MKKEWRCSIGIQDHWVPFMSHNIVPCGLADQLTNDVLVYERIHNTINAIKRIECTWLRIFRYSGQCSVLINPDNAAVVQMHLHLHWHTREAESHCRAAYSNLQLVHPRCFRIVAKESVRTSREPINSRVSRLLLCRVIISPANHSRPLT